jgi:hypothetical protein
MPQPGRNDNAPSMLRNTEFSGASGVSSWIDGETLRGAAE